MTTAATRPEARPDRGLREVKLVVRQVKYEQLTFWRNPIGAFVTLGFSLLFLVLLGGGAGASRVAALGGARLIQYYVPGFIGYGVMAACFLNLTANIVVRRETGLLKRLRLSPIPAWALMSALFASALVVAMLQVVLLLLLGRLAFHVRLPNQPAALLLALVVGAFCFTALGVLVSTIVPNQEAGGPVTSVVFFVLVGLSGLYFPIKRGSQAAAAANLLPIHPFISALFAPFDPGRSAWAWSDLLTLLIWGLVAAVVGARRFEWAPRQRSARRALRRSRRWA